MDQESNSFPKVTRENFAGWNCLLTILGLNLILFIMATYVAKCG